MQPWHGQFLMAPRFGDMLVMTPERQYRQLVLAQNRRFGVLRVV